MKSSSKEVIEDMISIVENQLQNYFAGGAEYIDKIQFQAKAWPKVFIYNESASTIEQNRNTVNLTVNFLDVGESLNNKTKLDYEIKSDMEQAASLFIDYLIEYEILTSYSNITFEPVTITGGDGLSGGFMTLSIPLEKPCIVPIPVIPENNAFPYTFPFTLN